MLLRILRRKRFIHVRCYSLRVVQCSVVWYCVVWGGMFFHSMLSFAYNFHFSFSIVSSSVFHLTSFIKQFSNLTKFTILTQLNDIRYLLLLFRTLIGTQINVITARTELNICGSKSCGATYRFPRYNDVSKVTFFIFHSLSYSLFLFSLCTQCYKFCFISYSCISPLLLLDVVRQKKQKNASKNS